MCRAPHLTHPPTQRAVRLPEGTRLEGPGRTWKDHTRQEERRPSTPWLVGRAPNFGTFSAYEVCDGGFLPSGLGVAGFPSGGCPWDSASVSALRVTALLATWLARVSTPERRCRGRDGSR